MPPITLAATAIDTSGPPGTARKPSRTTANAGNAATTAPNPTRLAVLSAGSTEALAPASSVLRSSGKRLRWISHQNQRGNRQRRHDRPRAAHRGQGGIESRFGEEPGVDARQHQKAHDEVDRKHDENRQMDERKRRQLLALMTMRQFGRVEVFGIRGLRAYQLIIGRRRCLGAVALAGGTRARLDRAAATTGRSPP